METGLSMLCTSSFLSMEPLEGEEARTGLCSNGCESAYCSEDEESPCRGDRGQRGSACCPLSLSFPTVEKEIDVDVAIIGKQFKSNEYF